MNNNVSVSEVYQTLSPESMEMLKESTREKTALTFKAVGLYQQSISFLRIKG